MHRARWRWTCIRELALYRCRLQRCSRIVVSVDANLADDRDLYANAEIQVSQSYRTTNMRKKSLK